MLRRYQIPPGGLPLALETLLLGLSASFLLFPSQVPWATALAMGLLVSLWLGEAALRRPWPITPFNGALLPLLGMAVVGILVSPYPDLTLSKATCFVLGVGLFRWAAQMRRERARRAALVLFLLAAMAVWGVGFLGAAWTIKVPFLQPWLDRLPTWAISVPGAPEGGISPNQLGGTLVLILPVPVALALGGNVSHSSLPRQLVGAVLASLWVATLILTQSRGGWIGGVAALLTLAVLAGFRGGKPWHRWASVALLLIIVLGVAGLLAWYGPKQVGEFFYGVAVGPTDTVVGDVTIQGRVEIWSRALYAIQDFPFSGCGLGTFRRVVWVLYPLFTIPLGYEISHAHNVFLQMGLDLGLPGLVAYLGLLGVAGAAAWKVARQGGVKRSLALGILAGLVGYHIHGLADVVALGSRPHFLLWWMLGLLAAMV